MLVFRCAAHRLAIPATEVLEIMRPLPVKPINSSYPFLAGMAVIRGKAVPVINVIRWFDTESRESALRFITLRVGQRVVALGVSEVIGLKVFLAPQLGALPPLLGNSNTLAITGLEVLDRELLVILNSAKILSDEQWAELPNSVMT
jgi:purine-binding chemotaxis protein CheW